MNDGVERVSRFELAARFANAHKVRILPFTEGSLMGDRSGIVPAVSWFSASMQPAFLQCHFTGPNANRNMGMPCGEINQIVAVDCDVKNGANGVEQFETLCRELGNCKPSSVWQSTPSGGRHYFYKYDPRCFRNRVRITLGGKKLNIDFRTDGGYIRLDMFNRAYQMHGMLYEAPEMPEWLVSIMAPADEPVKTEASVVARLMRKSLKKIEDAPKGERNDTLNRMSYVLGRAFADDPENHEMVMDELVRSATSIGLPHDESLRTARSGFEAGVRRGPFRDNRLPPELAGEASEDDAPEDIFMGRLPHPPLQVFPKKLTKLARQLAKKRGIPHEMLLGAILALGSTCLGQGAQVVYDRMWKEFANLFILTVGESGIGKTLAFHHIFSYLLRKEKENKRLFKLAREAYEQDLARWKKKKNPDAPVPVPPRNVHYVLEDSTIEAALDTIKDNPRGLLWGIDETRKWFTRLDRYSNDSGDGKSKILAGWESKHLSVMRKAHDGHYNETYIPSLTFSFFGNIQPGFVKELFHDDDIEQGVPQRFLFIRAQQKKPVKYPLDPLDPEQDAILKHVTERLLSVGTETVDEPFVSEMGSVCKNVNRDVVPDEIVLSPGAKRIFDDHINYLSYTTFALPTQSYAAKMNRMILRLALILHALHWAAGDRREIPKELPFERMLDAVYLSTWFMFHTARIRKFLPASDNESLIAGDSAVVESFAQIILDHEVEIGSMPGRFVPNNIWTEWLRAEGLEISGKAIREICKRLHVQDHRTSKNRGKTFDPVCLEYCRKAVAPAQSLIGMTETEEEQLELATFSWNGGDPRLSPKEPARPLLKPRPIPEPPKKITPYPVVGLEAMRVYNQEYEERMRKKAEGEAAVLERPEEPAAAASTPEIRTELAEPAAPETPEQASSAPQAPDKSLAEAPLDNSGSAIQADPQTSPASRETVVVETRSIPAPKIMPLRGAKTDEFGGARECVSESYTQEELRRNAREMMSEIMKRPLAPGSRERNEEFERREREREIDPATGLPRCKPRGEYIDDPEDDGEDS